MGLSRRSDFLACLLALALLWVQGCWNMACRGFNATLRAQAARLVEGGAEFAT